MAMTTRSTARRVLRSDTAPARRLLELENGDNGTAAHNPAPDQQLDTAIAGMRQEMTALQDSLRQEVTASMTNVSERITAEMLEIQGQLANLVQGRTNMVTTLNQTQAMAQAAQQMAAEARDRAIQQPQQSQQTTVVEPQRIVTTVRQSEDINMASPVTTPEASITTVSTSQPRLRKMDVNPPIFDGLIDGIKLNSFLFQFENYFEQKGYDLQQHDHLLIRELNQCVRKNAVVWYERYMADDYSVKLWSAAKEEMKREFREPNFDDKVRNQLLTMRQTGAYPGYVSKFRDLQRVVRLDDLTAVNLFVNGLANNEMKKAIQRKQPTSLTEAVREGFLEWDVQEKQPGNQQSDNTHGKKSRGPGGKSNWSGTNPKPTPGNKFLGNTQPPQARTSKPAATLCPHCHRGMHREEDCWVKHPEKKPRQFQRKQQLHQQIYALLETLAVGDEQPRSSAATEPSN